MEKEGKTGNKRHEKYNRRGESSEGIKYSSLWSDQTLANKFWGLIQEDVTFWRAKGGLSEARQGREGQGRQCRWCAKGGPIVICVGSLSCSIVIRLSGLHRELLLLLSILSESSWLDAGKEKKTVTFYLLQLSFSLFHSLFPHPCILLLPSLTTFSLCLLPLPPPSIHLAFKELLMTRRLEWDTPRKWQVTVSFHPCCSGVAWVGGGLVVV